MSDNIIVLLVLTFLMYKLIEDDRRKYAFSGYLPGRQAINEETWEWVDWRGQKRKITVHRKVTFL